MASTGFLSQACVYLAAAVLAMPLLLSALGETATAAAAGSSSTSRGTIGRRLRVVARCWQNPDG